jgi:hypothetical protein
VHNCATCNLHSSADQDVRHSTATSTRTQITQFGRAQDGRSVATGLPPQRKPLVSMRSVCDPLGLFAVPGGKVEVAASGQLSPPEPG